MSPADKALFVLCLALWPLCAAIELVIGGLGYSLLWLSDRLPWRC